MNKYQESVSILYPKNFKHWWSLNFLKQAIALKICKNADNWNSVTLKSNAYTSDWMCITVEILFFFSCFLSFPLRFCLRFIHSRVLPWTFWDSVWNQCRSVYMKSTVSYCLGDSRNFLFNDLSKKCHRYLRKPLILFFSWNMGYQV